METQSAPPDSPAEVPAAPAPSRADTPTPAEPQKKSRREQRAERKAEKERERKQLESQAKMRKDAPVEERRRGAVIGFLISCWAELKKVQWPDRDTLVQASAVTLIFVAVMAAYLGALDAAFNWLVKQVL